ncbi:hypothetical protein [Vibrio profundi]
MFNSTSIKLASVSGASASGRLPVPNRHIHSHGHYRTPQKSA